MTNLIWIDFGSIIWIHCDCLKSIVTLHLGFVRIVWWVNIRFWSAWRRSCVDLAAEIICRSRTALDSLVFSSDLKNLHWGGECRERIKNRDDRVFKLINRGSVDLAVDRHKQELKLVNRSVDWCCTREENLVGGRPCSRPTQLSEINRVLGLGSSRPVQL